MAQDFPGLLARTRKSIQRWHREAPLSAILWSGGKDSMALLHLLREAGLQLPVIFFREPWQPQRYAFHDQLIRDWGLQVISWHPSLTAFQATGHEFELQNIYTLDAGSFSCPTGITHRGAGPSSGPEEPWACAIEMARRPRQERLEMHTPFQAFWVGHKGCDSDVVLGGAAGTGVDAAMRVDGALALFPLRHWSHADIWRYIEEFDVPYDRERYGAIDKKHGHPVEWPDRQHNADYVRTCTACIDPRPDAPRFVYCPKLDAQVVNCSDAVPWTEPTRPKYVLAEGDRASA